MLHRYSMRFPFVAAIAAALIAVGTGAWAAPADDLKEAQKLYSQGKVQPAMDKVDAVLKAQPKDPQARFLKGLLLTEQKKTADAITGRSPVLTEDYPELPEPYNNLAVLYASQGNYDKAKAALELAIHTHPSYATAHENLGDVYAQLASRAYDRALQLDKTTPRRR
jgi:tetratricopeptide (TPR) repeat protein